MKCLLKILALSIMVFIFVAGCVTAIPLEVIRTSELLPQKSTNPPTELAFPLRIERFVDGRYNRTSVGYKVVGHGTVPLTADSDIVPVFEKLVTQEFEQKGIQNSASLLALRGIIQRISVVTIPSSEGVTGEVAIELTIYNTKTNAQLWSNVYSGKAVGREHQIVLALAFQDMATAIRQDSSILQLKDIYLASISEKADEGKKFPLSSTLPTQQTVKDTTKAELMREIENIPELKIEKKKDNFAVVVGIEKYRDIKAVEFAVKDAVTMQKYLTKLMGYHEENVMLLTNDRATKSDIEKYFGTWLKNRVNEKSTVFIYYAGHGAPNPKTGEAFIVPYDGDPNYLETTAYPLKNLYASLAELPAKEIIVTLDSCFSGAGGRSVIAKGARPLVMSIESPVTIKANMVVFAAASGGQISTFYEKAGHGLFTYFFLKGLKGEADMDKDDTVTVEELYKS